jgi:hypothetical protein
VRIGRLLGPLVAVLAGAGCGGRVVDGGTGDGGDEGGTGDGGEVGGVSSASSTDGGPQCAPDTVEMDCGFDATCVDGECVYEDPPCDEPGGCDPPRIEDLDVLFVVDNAASMGEEQGILAAHAGVLVDQLATLEDGYGNLLYPDVHLMVTSGDMGHPLCDQPQPDYEPARGAPISTPCTQRADHFADPDVCAQACPASVGPLDAFVAFGPEGTNVPGDDVKAALACLLPVGTNGCVYGSPLESMVRALDPAADWNLGPRPFLREHSLVLIVLVADKYDCSVDPAVGFPYFLGPQFDVYWEIDPLVDAKTEPTPAICFNAATDWSGVTPDGVYEDVVVADLGVLHPIERYTDRLADLGRPVVMLELVGVPEVTAHSPAPPFQPIGGGVDDLVIRRWQDAAWPGGDLLPGDPEDGPRKEWRWGVGPACTGQDGQGGFLGQALPSLRTNAVCRALDRGPDRADLRCVTESICDLDLSLAFGSLVAMAQQVVAVP